MQNKKETVLVNVLGVVSPLIGATVTVLTNPGATPASLFSDNGVTAMTNPFNTDANGAYSFYAADGRYTVNIVKAGYVAIAEDLILDDPNDVNITRVVTAVGATDAVPLAQVQSLIAALTATLNTWTKGQISQPVALAVAANVVTLDLSLSNNFTLPLQATTGQTLANPTNAVAGQSGQITITQNAIPSSLALGSNWVSTDGTTQAVSITAGAVNLLTYYVVDATHIWFNISKHGVA